MKYTLPFCGCCYDRNFSFQSTAFYRGRCVSTEFLDTLVDRWTQHRKKCETDTFSDV